MPNAPKRTRHAPEEDENAPPARSTPRRAASSTTSTTTPGESSTRPHLTRSATNAILTPSPSPLTRSTSAIHTRRSSSSSSSSSYSPAGPSTPPTPLTMGGGNSLRGGGVGVLVRTHSTPTLGAGATISSMKDMVASGHGHPGRGKGDEGPEDVFGSARKLGKGKENIPPKKDSEEENSRKRLRVSRTASIGRGRSGSVASVRSESSSIGRHPSLGASSSFGARPSQIYPSPSPSPSNTTFASQDASSVTSMDPLDLLERDNDIDRTPTKPRAVPRRTLTLPTPPPSFPREEALLEETAHGIEMIRVKSSASSASVTDIDMEIEEEVEIKAKNAYRHLKSFLRLSSGQTRGAADQVIVGREDEKAILRSYLSLRGRGDVGLYVSGPPGTGKTALVTALGREMGGEGWKVVEVGCMGMKVGDLWSRLGSALGAEQSEEGVLEAIKEGQQNTLIILDEIDSLLPPPPILPTSNTSHLLSKIFSLPLLSRPESTIKLISISNTLDLTVRARLVLPEGTQPQVLPFKAYVAADMMGIINSRLAAASAGVADEDMLKVDAKAVELLTRKVEAQNGDLRMCLGCLSTAVNMSETEWVKKAFQVDTDASTPLVKVALPHILKAFSSHTQQLKAAAGTTTTGLVSPTGKKIRSVPLQGKMVLVSILVYLARTRVGLSGCPSNGGSANNSPNNTPTKGGDLTTATLYATYAALLSHHTSPFPPAAESDYRDLLSNLETLGLVAIGGASAMSRSSSAASGRGRTSSAPKVELCAREEEIRDGLGLGAKEGVKGSADAEVAKIWVREEEKVERARTRAAAALEKGDDIL